jgi:hypothetical protein
MYYLLFFGLPVGVLMSIVTPLTTIIALSISSFLGALIGKMTNLSTFETRRGHFSWHRTSFVIGCCLIDLLHLTNIILGIILSLSWSGSYFHRLYQLIDILHLLQDLLYGLKKLGLDDQQLLKRWGWVLNVIVVTIVEIAASVVYHLNDRGWWNDKIQDKDEL